LLANESPGFGAGWFASKLAPTKSQSPTLERDHPVTPPSRARQKCPCDNPPLQACLQALSFLLTPVFSGFYFYLKFQQLKYLAQSVPCLLSTRGRARVLESRRRS